MSAVLRWLTATTIGLVIGGFALPCPGSQEAPQGREARDPSAAADQPVGGMLWLIRNRFPGS